jgi:hypothetical protein
MRKKRWNPLYKHSLSLVAFAILLLWVVLYARSDPRRHAGAFFGNAVADWTGVVVAVIGTKFLIERGSPESRQVRGREKTRLGRFLFEHSLTIFLAVTGLVWLAVYVRVDPTSKWGQVVGNTLSEWVQLIGLVLLTKRFIERGSKESR